jgi:glycosyltransferase involved in cell wall biosynthesis
LEKPLVSIVIPLYNRAELIVETVNSLIKQSYGNWEAIIVDDYSTDNSYEVALQLSRTDSRIRVFHRESKVKGAPACRNFGIEKAEGEYLMFLDSDDLLAPWCLQERVQEFMNNPDNDFLVFQATMFEQQPADSRVVWNRFSEEEDIRRFLQYDTVWIISSPIWKTSFLKINNLFFTEMARSTQDWEFHVRALLVANKYRKSENLPDNFVRRDDKAGKISSTHHSREKIQNRIELYKHLVNKYEILSTNPAYRTRIRKTILREVFNLQSRHGKIDLKSVNWVKDRPGLNFHGRIVFLYLRLANALVTGNKPLFNFCKRLFYYYLNYFFKNASKYKSPLLPDEIEQLRRKLKAAEETNNCSVE